MGRLDTLLIPLSRPELRTVLWFDLELVLFLSLGGQLLQGFALRSLNVATVVALTSYGSIFAGLIASILVLGERLTGGEIVAGLFLLVALALTLLPAGLQPRRNASRASSG
jgi:drug/metabolite transporter (DMT)-like permease